MAVRALIKGVLTFVPGSKRFLSYHRTGGTNSAMYCYGVWIKHLTMLHEHGFNEIPNTVAELGPGDSLGIGLAALLSGSNQYYALDVVPFANVETNLKIFDELVELFRTRARSPAAGFPNFWQYLNGDLFPHHILTDEVLRGSLSERRVDTIRRALANPGHTVDGITIEYLVPWSDDSVVLPNSVDLALSHSVLEHVVDLRATYRALNRWLKKGGVMSHQIDFGAHGLSRRWNGYRAFPELLWKAIIGRRKFLINRAPCSVHRQLIAQNGFDSICDMPCLRDDGIKRSQLARKWRSISDEDLHCASVFVQARKTCDSPIGRPSLQPTDGLLIDD